MTKQLLIKYICGEASVQEEGLVHAWLRADERNMRYFIELKQVWVLQNMPDIPPTAEQMRQLAGICGASVPVAKTTRSIWRRSMVAAVMVALLGLNIYLLADKLNSVKPLEEEGRVLLADLPGAYKHTVYTNKGTKARFDLPDGSKVWLNADSRITFPDKFLGTTREIELSGEAFFDVVSDSLNPMIISTNKQLKVKVLGTKLNIKSYDNDAESVTTLVSGEVELLHDKTGLQKTVLAKLQNEQSYILRNNERRGLVQRSDTTKQIAWKNGYLIFEETPLSEVIKQLERWHGAKFMIEDASILDYKYTAEFHSESMIQILSMLKFISRIDYSIKENVVYLRARDNKQI